MPSAREIRRRIRSVKNTTQITKAMEMVSAAKMRRAQGLVLAARPYAERIAELIAALAAQRRQGEDVHPLLQRRRPQRIGLVLITTDRGLCGGLNTRTIQAAVSYMVERDLPTSLVTVGRKGRDWMLRRGREVHAEFGSLGDRPTLLEVAPISRVAIDSYTEGLVDEVHLVYPKFVSTAAQEPVRQQLLPVQPAPEYAEHYLDFIYEPDPQTVLAQLLPRFVEVEVYQAILETLASEHSARMVAMHNATENGNEIVQELTLSYNKARQAGITKEILEIAGGAEALRQASV